LFFRYFTNLTSQEIIYILIETGNYNENLKDISTHCVVVVALKSLKKADEVSNAIAGVTAPAKAETKTNTKSSKKSKK
ncbi:hypothetical protein, partial [Ornithobacterium rhinotracheale]